MACAHPCSAAWVNHRTASCMCFQTRATLLVRKVPKPPGNGIIKQNVYIDCCIDPRRNGQTMEASTPNPCFSGRFYKTYSMDAPHMVQGGLSTSVSFLLSITAFKVDTLWVFSQHCSQDLHMRIQLCFFFFTFILWHRKIVSF